MSVHLLIRWSQVRILLGAQSAGRPFSERCWRCSPRQTLSIKPTQRREHAQRENWLGEIEGIDLTLTFLRIKRRAERLSSRPLIQLGIPRAREDGG